MKRISLFFMVALATLCFSACNKKAFPEPTIIHNAVTDLDGNSYDAVQIGNQVWMAENLRTKTIKTKENEIMHLQIDGEGFNMWDGTGAAYCYPDGRPENEEQYGLLYSEYFVFADETPLIICPDGWHLPNSSEWETLKTTVAEMSGEKPNKIAAYLCGNVGWKKSSKANAGGNLNSPGRNFTGFSALPADDNTYQSENSDSNFGKYAQFLCYTEWPEAPYPLNNFYAKEVVISYESSNVPVFDDSSNNLFEFGYNCGYKSVRCVRDE